jgi:DNA-binding response OmpR family regulator
MYKVFLVEDDEAISRLLKKHLESWGLEVVTAEDLSCVLEEFWRCQPHIVLLDISLPFYNGYYWCRQIRRSSQVPVVFLSSASDNMNIVMAMDMGGDDFIAKPFDVSVLSAKLQAILRRAYDYAPPSPVISARGVVLNTADASLQWQERRIDLTKNEYRILETLMKRRGTIVSRDALMERLWETDSFVDENTLTVNIARLRRKLAGAGLEDFVVTKKGIGYMVEDA